MREKWNFVLYLVWFSYLILSAVRMFGHGFLLSRKTLSDVSECVQLNKFNCDGQNHGDQNADFVCDNGTKITRILSNPGAPMLCPQKTNRVVFVLVDALRYDFTEYNAQITKPLPYQNRLPVIKETLEKWPIRTRLFRFVADPPTTTLQRVKALVTGSLPTFIEYSSNFDATEMQEDNVIDQVTRGGAKAILLGDDTWARLIPGRWLRSHALYSFHTWDLDSIDTEVDSKIYDELKKDDWDVLIAHYLGVDHAGHRYGPIHPEMTRKLEETNVRLKKIIETLPSDIILYVVGDHGMTESGDHGGESRAERTAAFFAYRGDGLAGDGADVQMGREVQQTEFAPTLSAALGRPPPAPSLGNILLPVLPPASVPETLLLVTNNLKQVTRYLVRYGEESQEIPLEKLASLINGTRDQIQKAAFVKTEEDLKKYVDDVRSMIDNIRGVFREVWVEFDSLSMLRALLLLLLAIFFNWLIAEGIPMDRLPQIFASTFVSTGYLALAVCTAFCLTGFYFEVFKDLEHAIILSTGLVSGFLMCILTIMHWDGITQRWFETSSLFYERFARASLVASAGVLFTNSFIIEEGASLAFLTISVLAVMSFFIGTIEACSLWGLVGFVLVLSRSYRGCREEQGDCWTQGGNISSTQASRAALVIALGSMAGVVVICRRHVGWRGHGVVLIGLLTCAHWAVGWGSLGSPVRARMIARLAWFFLGLMLLFVWKRDGVGGQLPLTVLALLLYVANSLVLGAAFAPTASLALLSGYLVLIIVTKLKNDGSTKFSLLTRCHSCVACLWCLLASYHFYGTGHHATLGHVRWGPAFHAGDPTYTPIGPFIIAVLLALELFGMPLLYGVSVPLLALWGRNGASVAGPRTQMAAVFSLCLKFGLCFAIRVFACAISATIHCRHLMIWGVFTPKLMFETGSCGAALLGTVIGCALTAWHLPTNQRPS